MRNVLCALAENTFLCQQHMWKNHRSTSMLTIWNHNNLVREVLTNFYAIEAKLLPNGHVLARTVHGLSLLFPHPQDEWTRRGFDWTDPKSSSWDAPLFLHDPRESQIYWLDESGDLSPLPYQGPVARFCTGIDGGPSEQGLPFRPLGRFWYYGDVCGDHEQMWPAPDWKTVMWPTIFHSRVFVDEAGTTWRKIISYSDGERVIRCLKDAEELGPLLKASQKSQEELPDEIALEK